MLTMSGSGLGGADQTQAIRLQESGIASTRWRSDSYVRCKMIWGTSSKLFSLNLLLMDRVSKTFLYDIKAMQLFGSTFKDQPNSGSNWILIASSNLGRYDSSQSFVLVFSASEATFWEADSRIQTKSVASAASAVLLTLSCSGQVSSTTSAFSFDNIVNRMVSPNNIPATGPHILPLAGFSYGMNRYSTSVRVGSTTALFNDWKSVSAVSVKCSAGIGSGPAGCTNVPPPKMAVADCLRLLQIQDLQAASAVALRLVPAVSRSVIRAHQHLAHFSILTLKIT